MTDEFDDVTYQEGDLLIVGMGAPNLSWTATIQLESGRCNARRMRGSGPSEELEFVFEAGDLTLLEDAAADIFMEGDVDHREQFAQAGVEIRAVMDGEEVTARYAVEGALPEHDDVYSLIGRRVLSE